MQIVLLVMTNNVIVDVCFVTILNYACGCSLGSTARAVGGIQSLGKLLPQAAAWARAQPTDVEDRLQLLRRLLFLLSNLCSQAVDPRCGEMLC